MGVSTQTATWLEAHERREAERRRAYLRALGPDELIAHRDAARYELAAAAEQAVARVFARREVEEADAELTRRRRLHAADRSLPDPDGPVTAAWLALAADIRGRADLPALCARMGHELTRVGRDRRSGGDEWAGACPWCGGDDRFRVWDRPQGHYWCRQCGESGDAIRYFRRRWGGGRLGWRETLRVAAEELGLRTPDDGPAPPTSLHPPRPMEAI